MGLINRYPDLAFFDLRYWYNTLVGIDNKNYSTTGTLGAGATTLTGNLIVGSNTTGLTATVNGTLGSELAPAISAANWNSGAGWTIGTGSFAADATGRSDCSPTVALTIVAGTTYKVVTVCSSYTASHISIRLGGRNGSVINATGTYTDYITAIDTTNLKYTKHNDARLTINSVSVKAVTVNTGDITVDGRYLGSASIWNGSSNPAIIQGTGLDIATKSGPFTSAFSIYDTVNSKYWFRIGCANASLPFFSVGNGTVGSTAPNFYPYSTSSAASDLDGIHLGFFCYDSATQTNASGDFAFTGGNKTITSGQAVHMLMTRSFTPTSGTGAFWMLQLNPTINQTGGATGETIGIRFNTTLTSAYDWKSFWTNVNTGYNLYFTGASANNFIAGKLGLGIPTPTPPSSGAPTALLHLGAGTAAASTAPLKFTSGTLLTAAEAGAVEFTTDDYYATITTGAARKGIVLNDGTNLTSGKIPVATTNGRLIDVTAQTELTDEDSTATDGTDATQDQLINNMRTRINELETKLVALGLLADAD